MNNKRYNDRVHAHLYVMCVYSTYVVHDKMILCANIGKIIILNII